MCMWCTSSITCSYGRWLVLGHACVFVRNCKTSGSFEHFQVSVCEIVFKTALKSLLFPFVAHIYIYNFKEKLKRKECEFCETSLICCLFVCWFVYLFVCLVVRLRSPFSVFVSIFLFISFSIGFMLSLHLSIMRGHDRTIFQPKKIFLLIKSQMHINLFVRFCIHYYIHTNIHIIC